MLVSLSQGADSVRSHDWSSSFVDSGWQTKKKVTGADHSWGRNSLRKKAHRSATITFDNLFLIVISSWPETQGNSCL